MSKPASLSPTTSQYQTLETIARLIRERGVIAPTVREIADATGKAVATIHAHLTKLRDRGLLTWEEDKARTLTITEAGYRQLGRSRKSA